MSQLVPGGKRVARQKAAGLLKGSSEDRDCWQGTAQNEMPKRYRSIYLAVIVCKCHLR